MHPRANLWDLEDERAVNLLTEVFEYCKKNAMPILLHTGEDDGLDEPTRFLPFFEEFPDVAVTLAHCRTIETAIKILQKLPAYKGDSAFVPESSFHRLKEAGLFERVVFGSDFPITHYFATKYGENIVSLKEQYAKDLVERKKNF